MRIEEVTTDQQLEDAYSVRKIVFVEEQNVSMEEEMDEFDGVATHFVGYEGDQPISASRLRFVDEYAKLERICMIKSSRGQGLGKQMILHMEDHAKDMGYLKSKLNAQIQALGFYESLGYKVVSEEFMDAGIPHVTMIKDL
ncbi:GNAT family N-acetyltransferase [Pontibacillus salipaludis]|uniref:N-acetyltransferase YjcF n=1 Tax=Pontibacillus salipaludis TaxID=1697394 RepID=A0ABQ1Q9M9_9BACI|nr:GNAT family N-acetyltransferase [Pontibacillus salipaludis]GGD18469.1 putative N-acetyltransferase YjcF [Pontibacillus salipaludis]